MDLFESWGQIERSQKLGFGSKELMDLNDTFFILIYDGYDGYDVYDGYDHLFFK